MICVRLLKHLRLFNKVQNGMERGVGKAAVGGGGRWRGGRAMEGRLERQKGGGRSTRGGAVVDQKGKINKHLWGEKGVQSTIRGTEMS